MALSLAQSVVVQAALWGGEGVALRAPTGLAAVRVDARRVRFAYAAAAGAEGYERQALPPGEGEWRPAQPNASSGLRWSIASSAVGEWRFRVRAVYSAGASAWAELAVRL